MGGTATPAALRSLGAAAAAGIPLPIDAARAAARVIAGCCVGAASAAESSVAAGADCNAIAAALPGLLPPAPAASRLAALLPLGDVPDIPINEVAAAGAAAARTMSVGRGAGGAFSWKPIVDTTAAGAGTPVAAAEATGDAPLLMPGAGGDTGAEAEIGGCAAVGALGDTPVEDEPTTRGSAAASTPILLAERRRLAVSSSMYCAG